jgi:hypothetical protein
LMMSFGISTALLLELLCVLVGQRVAGSHREESRLRSKPTSRWTPTRC